MNEILLQKVKWSFLAQVSSICVSVGMGLILPKYLSVTDYAYWQLFIVYSVCYELLLFGVPNGFFLKNAGKEVNDYSYLKTSFLLLMIINGIIGFFVCIFTNESGVESFVYYSLSIAIVIINCVMFLSLIVRTQNDIKFDSFVMMVMHICVIIGLCIQFFMDVCDVRIVIALYILAFAVRALLLVIRLKKIFKANFVINRQFITKVLSDSMVGLKVIWIDYTNILVFGACRLICKAAMGMMVFGYLSFALSLVILAINFINQLSLSIFPTLRKLNEKNVIAIYVKMRNYTSSIFLVAMLLYSPVTFALSLWLPQYTGAFKLILMVFPLVVLDGKMQTVFSMVLKLFRKESLLLKINIIYSISTIIVCYFAINFLLDVEYLILTLLIMTGTRSIVVEFIISELFGVYNFKRKILLEIIAVVLFLITFTFVGSPMAWFVFMVPNVFIIYFNYSKCNVLQIEKS